MSASRWSLWNWPFIEAQHHDVAHRVIAWNEENHGHTYPDLAAECRAIAFSLGKARLLDYLVPEEGDPFDVRAICVIREALTYDHALADAIFTMQGIGTLAIQRLGTPAQKARYLGPCRTGTHIAALALTEPDAGSDVASLTTSAVRDGGDYVLNGEKTLISNAAFADHFLVVARTGEAPGSRGLSVFIVDRGTKGMEIGAPIDFIAPHPAAPIRFRDCRIPAENMLGEPGLGFKTAMGALDVFRPSVGAAAVGLARRALHETLDRVTSRRMFGKPMSALDGVQSALADMATDIDASALLVYRAAWTSDREGRPNSYESSMAKLAATEAAGRVVDRAVQIFGGLGVTQGTMVEKLFREARPMRIYEGASEIQKIVIARNLLAAAAASVPAEKKAS
jgi:acyl-CoA dehydrogenase